MKDYMKIYREWLSNPYFDEDTKAELKDGWNVTIKIFRCNYNNFYIITIFAPGIV